MSALLKTSYIHFVLIALVGLFVYSNTFNVPFQLDDKQNIVDNPLVKDLGYYVEPSEAAEVWRDNYAQFRSRIVGYLTFALDYKLHGLDVTGYHLVNILVHLLNALLIYALVLTAFKTPLLKNNARNGIDRNAAFFSGLLFVSHPIETQAVTYIVQRFASLATLFYLASILSFIKFRLSERPSRRIIFYALTLAFALLSLKTKETAVTLPVTIAFFEFIFFRDSLKKRILYLVPLILMLATVPLSYIALGKTLSDTSKIHTSISRLDYLFTQFTAIVMYIRLLLFPVNQNLDYDYPLYDSLFQPEVLVSFLFLLFSIAVGVFLILRSRRTARETRIVAFGIFWFFITMLPESSLIPIVDLVFEHRVYLPSIGLIIAVTVSAFILVNRMRSAKTIVAALIAAVISFSALSHERNFVWQNAISLWKDAASKSPGKARVRYNLGNSYSDNRFFGEAVNEYEAALSVMPDYERGHGKDSDHLRTALENKAYYFEVHNNLGIAYEKIGDYEKALEHYNASVNIRPDYAIAHNNLGVLNNKLERYDEAIKHYQKAISLNPDYAIAHNNLGLEYDNLGLLEAAIESYQYAIKADPNYADAHNNLGVAYGKMERYEEAIREIRNAISIEPGNEDYNHNLKYALNLWDKMRKE